MSKENLYFYSNEVDLFTFYRIPKELFSNSIFKDLSTEAKVLYGLLLDRNSLSIKNHWVDKLDRIYIIFKREDCQELLNVSDKTSTKLFKELKEYNLIDEVRQGLNKPNLIYVKKFISNKDIKTRKNYDSKDEENSTSEPEKITTQDTPIFTNQEQQDLRANYTNLNDFNFSNTDLNKTYSINQSIKKEDGLIDELQIIFETCQIELYNEPICSVIKNSITDMFLTDNFSKRIDIPYEIVKTRIKSITLSTIDKALANYKTAIENNTTITVPHKYFQRCIWSAINDDKLNFLGTM